MDLVIRVLLVTSKTILPRVHRSGNRQKILDTYQQHCMRRPEKINEPAAAGEEATFVFLVGGAPPVVHDVAAATSGWKGLGEALDVDGATAAAFETLGGVDADPIPLVVSITSMNRWYPLGSTGLGICVPTAS